MNSLPETSAGSQAVEEIVWLNDPNSEAVQARSGIVAACTCDCGTYAICVAD